MAMPLQDLKLKIQEELEKNPALELVNEKSDVSIDEMHSSRRVTPLDTIRRGRIPSRSSSKVPCPGPNRCRNISCGSYGSSPYLRSGSK
jgi:DNA-directed RNA polymerase specialized sigma54-like protein